VPGSSKVLLALVLATTTGCVATQRDHEALAAREAQLEQDLQKARSELAQTRADLEATRQRLDNALRASADSSTDLLSSKQRINDLAGRVDEAQHGVEDVRREIGATRTEIYARIDEMKRMQPTAPAPPITVPADRATHLKQLEEAHTKHDWQTLRALGNEYVNRYPTDDHADQALFLVGDGDLADGRPSSALASFNRLLKLFPRSPYLDRALYDMGEAYLLMHDCANAKLAYDACEKRFPKSKAGTDSHAKLQTIAKNAPGLCAPQ
jgi:TolA-binding protein